MHDNVISGAYGTIVLYVCEGGHASSAVHVLQTSGWRGGVLRLERGVHSDHCTTSLQLLLPSTVDEKVAP